MSNREAIALLRNLEDALDSYCELNEEGKTAFRMAIESLELFGNSEQLPSAQPVDKAYLCDWYINSVTESEPVWTEAHISELMGDFYIIPKRGEQDGNT